MSTFQSTLLQEERPRVSQQQFASWDYFNPRSYKRSDGFRVYGIPCTFKFQSTLLQEERRVSSIFTISCLYISIHAPTRGATRFRFRDNISTFYFNPRSYKRSDRYADLYFAIWQNFNPRSYKRSDLFSRRSFRERKISIHAPTRGATAKMHNIPYASLQ